MKIYKRLSFMLTDTMKNICVINLEVKLSLCGRNVCKVTVDM